DPEMFYAWLYGLTSFEKPELVKRTLEYSLSDEIRNQDFEGLIESTAYPIVNQQESWTFIKANWSRIAPKLATYSPGTIIKATSAFCEPALRTDVQNFFTQHRIEGADRSLRQTLEKIDNCLNLKQQQQTNLATWLQQRPGAAQGGSAESRAHQQ